MIPVMAVSVLWRKKSYPLAAYMRVAMVLSAVSRNGILSLPKGRPSSPEMASFLWHPTHADAVK
eukprot:2368698-Rhodomonas_salina.1